jgi:hypothetical protein
MKEHALPQDVIGYRFHIIGNMTLKQFGEVGAGCVVAFLIYSTNLVAIMKWPLMILFAGFGAFTAFVPFEERPFDHWIVAFFQALYRPTKFYWKRTTKTPEAFLYKPKSDQKSVVGDVDFHPARRQRVKEYIRSVNNDDAPSNAFEEPTEGRLGSVMELFTQQLPPSTPTAMPSSTPTLDVVSSGTPGVAPSAPPLIDDSSLNQLANQTSAVEISLSDSPTAHPAPKADTIPVNVPQQEFVAIHHAVADAASASAQAGDALQSSNADANIAETYITDQQLSGKRVEEPTSSVTQIKTLPFPNKPTEPNKLVGMVVDANEKPVPAAIVEVLTAEGLSARAVKTNPLGQFFITTPLNNGTYSIIAEKDGLTFSPQQLLLQGHIIDPIEVRSQNSLY